MTNIIMERIVQEVEESKNHNYGGPVYIQEIQVEYVGPLIKRIKTCKLERVT